MAQCCTTCHSCPCLFANTEQTADMDNIEVVVPSGLVYTSTQTSANCVARELAVARNYDLVCDELPVAEPQELETPYETSLDITLTGSTLAGGLYFTVLTLPSHGVLNGDVPDLNYTPEAGYSGEDSFTFSVNNGQTDSLPATITITVGEPDLGSLILATCEGEETACLHCDQSEGDDSVVIVNGFLSSFKEVECPS